MYIINLNATSAPVLNTIPRIYQKGTIPSSIPQFNRVDVQGGFPDLQERILKFVVTDIFFLGGESNAV